MDLNGDLYVNNGKIIGGYGNVATGTTSIFIGGGSGNRIISTGITYSFIGGGKSNLISGSTSNYSSYSFIGGGRHNTIADGSSSIILGGSGNTVNNTYGLILGGIWNLNESSGGIIVGGQSNTLDGGGRSLIVGGLTNTITGGYGFIGGGKSNTITTNTVDCSIIGGYNNNISSGLTSVHIIGSNITGTTDNTTYVEKLNLDTPLATGNTIDVLLVRDTDGTVMAREASTIGTDTVITGGTFTGETTLVLTDNVGNQVTTDLNPYVRKKTTQDFGTLTGTITWDMDEGNNAKVILSGNVSTFTISNVVDGDYGTIIITQDGTGSQTIVLPASSKAVSGGAGAITLTSTGGAIDVLSFFYDGTDYYWSPGYNYT